MRIHTSFSWQELGGQSFSIVLGWAKPLLYKHFVPYQAVLFLASLQSEQALQSVPVVSRLPTSSSSSLGYSRQKENPRNSPHAIPSVHQSLCLFSTFQRLLMFVLYVMFKIFSCFNGRNKKLYIYSIFLKAEAPLFKLVPTSPTTQIPGKMRVVDGRDFSLCKRYKVGPLSQPYNNVQITC